MNYVRIIFILILQLLTCAYVGIIININISIIQVYVNLMLYWCLCHLLSGSYKKCSSSQGVQIPRGQVGRTTKFCKVASNNF